MKIVSGKAGKPHVTSKQFRQILEGTLGQESGILTSGELLEPELVSNNRLKIRSGMMIHHGNVSSVELGTYDEVEITNGSQGMKRIDLVVNRYSRNDETKIESNDWIVIMGKPDTKNPVVPAYKKGNLQNGDLIDDCPVFEVHLDGINVVDVKPLLKVYPSIPELNGNFIAKTFTNIFKGTSGAGKQNEFPCPDGYKLFSISFNPTNSQVIPFGRYRDGIVTTNILFAPSVTTIDVTIETIVVLTKLF